MLKQLNVDYDYLFHAMPGHHLVVLNDAPKYTVVEANDSMLELIGMTREYLIERSLWDIYPGSSSTMSRRRK